MILLGRFPKAFQHCSRRVCAGLSCISLVVLCALALSFGTHKLHAKDKTTKAKTASRQTDLLANRPLPQGPDLQDISVVHHGRIIEVKGATDSGAIIMINGEPAATFFDGNRFKHFLGPMSPGIGIITITAQDGQGGVTTRQLAVQIE
jgi:hypothetical protein